MGLRDVQTLHWLSPTGQLYTWLWRRLNLHPEVCFFLSGLSGLQMHCPQDVQMIELTACLPKYPQTWSTGQGRARTCRNQLAVLQQSSGGLMICSPVAHPRIHSPTLRTPSPQTMERTKSPHCTDLVPETASGGKILPSPPATWKFLH